MSTTLTNGLKLPDKGSVDWYADMQNNYAILDGAVGTIAEHTSALAGKAPLVHTHSKSDITDFPAYGNTAGTICEGNDSRLSDARTPVAHTHGKADITDLFTSANTWSALNSYSADCIIYNSNSSGSVARLRLRNSKAEVLSTGNTGSTQSITFRDKNDFSFGYIYGTVQSNGTAVKIGAYAKDSSNNDVNTELQILSFTNGSKALFPATTNEYDLGISSFQWKSVQARSYYYNGTAWGLDKENHWTNNNTFDTTIRVKSLTQEIGVTPSASRYTYCDFRDKNEVSISQVITAQFANGYDTISLNMYNKYTNGVKDPNGTSVNAKFEVGLTPAGNPYLNTNGKWLCDLTPIVANLNLGTSTNKWKSLNGINPGALSLPKIVAKATANIASAIVGADNQQHLDGTDNNYTAALDGWISMCISGFTQSNELWITVYDMNNETWGTSAESSTRNTMFIIFPIRANQKMRIRMKCTSVEYARFYPCEGNV